VLSKQAKQKITIYVDCCWLQFGTLCFCSSFSFQFWFLLCSAALLLVFIRYRPDRSLNHLVLFRVFVPGTKGLPFSFSFTKKSTVGITLLQNWSRLTNDKRYVRSHHNRPPLESPFVIGWSVYISEYFSVSAADRASQASLSSPQFVRDFSASCHDCVSDRVLAHRPPASHEVWWPQSTRIDTLSALLLSCVLPDCNWAVSTGNFSIL